MQQKTRKLLVLILNSVLCAHWSKWLWKDHFPSSPGTREEAPTHSPHPCNSLILRYQVGISSEQSLLCHVTLPLSSLPPCPIGALAKERKKKTWLGSSSSFAVFSQISCYLNEEALYRLNLLCSAFWADSFPFFSCHEKAFWGSGVLPLSGMEVEQCSSSGQAQGYRIAQLLTPQ